MAKEAQIAVSLLSILGWMLIPRLKKSKLLGVPSLEDASHAPYIQVRIMSDECMLLDCLVVGFVVEVDLEEGSLLLPRSMFWTVLNRSSVKKMCKRDRIAIWSTIQRDPSSSVRVLPKVLRHQGAGLCLGQLSHCVICSSGVSVRRGT